MRVLLLAWIAAGTLSCGGLGGVGDECVTPGECEMGLQCFEGKCTDAVLGCGTGTEEVDGVCTAPRPLRCGSGTVEVDEQCVPEPADAGE